jgi:hypothetical protein
MRQRALAKLIGMLGALTRAQRKVGVAGTVRSAEQGLTLLSEVRQNLGSVSLAVADWFDLR